METHYLNTDLDIESLGSLDILVEEFGEEVVVLYNGSVMGHRRASFEVAGSSDCADSAMSTFCTLVEGLSGPAREVWDVSYRKVFDIGYQAGKFPTSYHAELRQQTVKRVGEIGASIAVSIYPASESGG